MYSAPASATSRSTSGVISERSKETWINPSRMLSSISVRHRRQFPSASARATTRWPTGRRASGACAVFGVARRLASDESIRRFMVVFAVSNPCLRCPWPKLQFHKCAPRSSADGRPPSAFLHCLDARHQEPRRSGRRCKDLTIRVIFRPQSLSTNGSSRPSRLRFATASRRLNLCVSQQQRIDN